MKNEIGRFIREHNLEGGEAAIAQRMLKKGAQRTEVELHLLTLGSDEMRTSLFEKALREIDQRYIYAVKLQKLPGQETKTMKTQREANIRKSQLGGFLNGLGLRIDK